METIAMDRYCIVIFRVRKTSCGWSKLDATPDGGGIKESAIVRTQLYHFVADFCVFSRNNRLSHLLTLSKIWFWVHEWYLFWSAWSLFTSVFVINPCTCETWCQAVRYMHMCCHMTMQFGFMRESDSLYVFISWDWNTGHWSCWSVGVFERHALLEMARP